jgi:DNA-binding MarR family transcriptional regulator
VSRSRITPLVASLVECGFVTRTESRRDRRARDLALTSRGQEVAEHAGNFRLDFHTQLLRTFPEAAREDLLKTLAVLHERIRKLRAELKTRDGRQRRE